MMTRQWTFDPASGGIRIPPEVRVDVQKRVQAIAAREFHGKYTRLEIRFKNQFCYVDAYTEPVLTKGWPPADWQLPRAEYIERLRRTPTHLCRLRYFGHDEWGFAFYSYGSNRYEFSAYDDGRFTGTPERAFTIAANVYLNEGAVPQ